MERVQQTGQQFQQQAQQGANTMRNWLTQSINNTAESLRYYVNRYPPLAAFLFTLLVLSAVPVATFGLFTFVTSAIFLSIALIGFGIVEGLCLMAGGGVLLTVLGGITLVTTIAFGWVAMIYAVWRSGSFVANKMMEGGQQLGQRTQEAIHQMQQSSQQQQPFSTGQSSFSQQQPSSSILGGSQQPM